MPWQPPMTLLATTNQSIGVQRSARADEAVPPSRCRMADARWAGYMAVAGEGMFDQDRVVPRGVEGPPRLVGDAHLRESSPGFQPKAADVHAAAASPRETPRAMLRSTRPTRGQAGALLKELQLSLGDLLR